MSRGDVVDVEAVQKARASLAALADTYPELRGPSGVANRARWEASLEETMAGAKTQEEQLVARLPQGMLAALDKYAERLRREQPGPTWRRSDVVRMLLTKSLEDAGLWPSK